MPLSEQQNGSTSFFLEEDASVLLPPSAPPACCWVFQYHTAVWCRHANAPLVKPLNKWKSSRMLKLLMVISTPSPSAIFTPLRFRLFCFPQPSDRSLHCWRRRITLVETPFIFIPSHPAFYLSVMCTLWPFRLITAVNNKDECGLFCRVQL